MRSRLALDHIRLLDTNEELKRRRSVPDYGLGKLVTSLKIYYIDSLLLLLTKVLFYSIFLISLKLHIVLIILIVYFNKQLNLPDTCSFLISLT